MRFIVFILPAASAHIIFNTGDVVMASPAANVETVPLERGGTRFLRAHGHDPKTLRDSDLSDEERMNFLKRFASRFGRSSESLPKEEVAEASARLNPYRSYVVDAKKDVDPALLNIINSEKYTFRDLKDLVGIQPMLFNEQSSKLRTYASMIMIEMSNLHNKKLDKLLTRIRGNETAMKHFPLYMDYTTPEKENLYQLINLGKEAVTEEKKEAYILLVKARKSYAKLTKPDRAI